MTNEKTGLSTTRRKALANATSPLNSKSAGLHRKSGHSGSSNNELSNHPLPVIPQELQVPYSSDQHAKGQFPLAPTLEESSSTDVRIRCQARWTYLCAILQYFKDDMAAWEGALYGRKTRWPSTLVLYIMDCVNSGLLEHFWVEWSSIVGSTPWLISQNHMTWEELDRFYSEPPAVVSDLEVATKEVYDQNCQENAQREGSDQPIPPSRAEEESPDLPVMPPQVAEGVQLSLPEERPHKFVLGGGWTMITESRTRTSENDRLPVTEAQTRALEGDLPVLMDINAELGAENIQEVLGDYLTEDAVAVRDLLLIELGLTGGESTEILVTTEAMEVDPPTVFMAEMEHQPMETRQLNVPPGTFQLELTKPGYTPSLIGSTDTPPSPITAVDNALLDVTDVETPVPDTSKAPGAGRPEGSLTQGSPSKSGMTLWKRKPPPT